MRKNNIKCTNMVGGVLGNCTYEKNYHECLQKTLHINWKDRRINARVLAQGNTASMKQHLCGTSSVRQDMS